MKIVILNHCYFTPDHIARLKKLGEVIEYPNTASTKDALERARGAEIAVGDCFEFSMDRDFFAEAAKATASTNGLKYLALNTTGFNFVDIAAAKEHGIKVSNIPNFSTEAVAEHAIALMFAVSKHIVLGDRAMHEKPFQLNPANRAHDMYMGTNLRGKTMGIIGLGHIGTRIAELGKGLGMNVIAYNRSAKNIPGVEMVALDAIFKRSDVVIPAVAFGEDLRNMIDAKALSMMKPTAIIVNIARGEFIDEPALAQALSEKRIAGLGADVIADWSTNNPIFHCDNVVLTPHMTFLADESLKNMADLIVENIASYVKGEGRNVVKP